MQIKYKILLSSLLLFIDGITKYSALSLLGSDSKIHLLGDIFFLELYKNTGIAFSIPVEGITLKIITLILIFLIVYYYIREESKKNSFLIDFAFVSIISGAIGNGFERLFFSEVIDFIGVKYFSVFNFADIFISIGGFLYLLSLYLGNKKTHFDQSK